MSDLFSDLSKFTNLQQTTRRPLFSEAERVTHARDLEVCAPPPRECLPPARHDDGMRHTLPYMPPHPSKAPRADMGWGQCAPHDLKETQRSRLEQLGEIVNGLRGARDAYNEWRKNNPSQPEPTNGDKKLGDILNDPHMPTGHMCVHVVAVILHECPGAFAEAGIPSHEIPGQRPSQPTQPQEPAAGGAPSTQIAQGIFGIFGQIAGLLGGILSSPAGIPLLTAACALIPGLQPLAPFVPIIAPIAGAALTGLGGASSQVAQGQAPSFGGAPAGGASPDLLGSLLGPLTGMFGGAAGGAVAPAPLPLPA